MTTKNISQEPSLKHRLLIAGKWVIGGFAAGQVIRLGGNLLLTRLLFPEAFGLMAVVYVLIIGLALFSDLGISQGVIRNPRGEEATYLNTAWTIQLFRGVVIGGLMIVIALLLPIASNNGWFPKDSVYANPLLPWLIAAFSVTAVIQGAESMNTALASRRLQLGILTKIELTSQGIALLVMLVIAWTYHSIWALVVGGIVSGAVKCVAGHIVLPGTRSSFHWDIASVWEIIHFGKWVFLLSIIGFVSINGDRLILADLVNATTLGIYSIAFLLANIINVAFSTISSKLIFPAISEVVQHHPDNIVKVYRKFQLATDIFLFSAAGFLLATGSYVVELLYDDRYHDAGRMLEVLSIGLIGSRYAVVEQFCMATGAMRILVIINLCRMLTLFVGLPWGYHYAGMDGALIAIIISQFAGWPVAQFMKFKHGLRLTSIGHEFIGAPIMALMAGVGWVAVWILK